MKTLINQLILGFFSCILLVSCTPFDELEDDPNSAHHCAALTALIRYF